MVGCARPDVPVATVSLPAPTAAALLLAVTGTASASMNAFTISLLFASRSATLGGADVPTTVIATLAFESGVAGGLVASFDVAASTAPHIEIHGTAGSLVLGDPNRFDGEVCYRPLGGDGWETVEPRFDTSVGRGIGLADMIDAIRTGRPHRASGDLAFHVLDVLLALEDATRSGAVGSIGSRTDRPAPLD